MESVTGLDEIITTDGLDELAERARLPMSLNIAGRIFMLLDAPNSTLDDIAEIIMTDVGLSGKVLRIANSPLFMGGGVETVTDALVYVGMDDVVSLVAASEIVRAFEDIPFHDNPYRFWHENLYAATAGQVLARHICLPEGRLFTVSLLRGIGELVIRTCLPGQAKTIVQRQSQSGEALDVIEKQILGFNHAELAAALLQRWHMPSSLILPIRYYVNPAETTEYRLEAVVVNVANYLKNEFFSVPQPELSNDLLDQNSDMSLQHIETIKPEIERLNEDAIKLVMG